MGYFDEYLSKNTNKSALKDTTKLQSELKVFDPQKVEVDVTENKYGYKAKDVANVAKLLHEANAHKLSVKTKLSKSPLLYKWEKDASGKKKKVKRGHFEKKKLLKDAEVYEEKVRNQVFPIAENKDTIEYSNILNVSVDEINVEDIPVDEETAVEETFVENSTYTDSKNIIVVDDEFPEQKDKKKLTLNVNDQRFLASQKEELSEKEVLMLRKITDKSVKIFEDPNVIPRFNVSDDMDDKQLIGALEFVRENVFNPHFRTLVGSRLKNSSFADIDNMDDLLSKLIDLGISNFTQKTWEELAFKFRLIFVACTEWDSVDIVEDGKLILQLSRVFTNRAS